MADEPVAARAEQASENDGDDEDVVELSRDGDEVRDEVEGEGEVAGKCCEEELVSSWHAFVGDQTGDEHDAVGDEACECSRLVAAAGEEQGADECEPDHGDQAE